MTSEDWKRLILRCLRGSDEDLDEVLKTSEAYVRNRFGGSLSPDQCRAVANEAVTEARAAFRRNRCMEEGELLNAFKRLIWRGRKRAQRQNKRRAHLAQRRDDWAEAEPAMASFLARHDDTLEVRQILDLALKEIFVAMEASLPRLQPRDRHMVISAYGLGRYFLSPQNIELPANPETLRKAIRRARRRLNELLEERLARDLEQADGDPISAYALAIVRGERLIDAMELQEELQAM